MLRLLLPDEGVRLRSARRTLLTLSGSRMLPTAFGGVIFSTSTRFSSGMNRFDIVQDVVRLKVNLDKIELLKAMYALLQITG